MKVLAAAGLVAASLLTACNTTSSAQTAIEPEASPSRVEADVRFLADDLLEGREAGTRGYDLAALYVSEQFRALGLDPGGDDGTYLQSIPLLKYALLQPAYTSLSVTEGAELELELGEDYLLSASAHVEEGLVDLGPVVRGEA